MRFSLLTFRAPALFCAISFFFLDIDPGRALPTLQPPQIKNEITPRVAVIHGSESTCGDTCPEWIAIEGKLTGETVTAFRAIIKKLGKTRLPVLVHSGGGLVHAAFEIGRLIRANHLDVGVARTEIIGCDPAKANCPKGTEDPLRGEPHSLNAICASACTFILAGGEHRYVAPWSRVGVHQVTDMEKLVTHHYTVRISKFVSPETEEITEKRTIVGTRDETQIIALDTPRHASVEEIRAYLKEMNVDLELQALMALTSPKDIRWMSHTELDDTRLATDFYGGETLIARSDVPASFDLIGPQLPVPNMQRPEVFGPEAPVTAAAFGQLKMPFANGKYAIVLVEFIRRRFNQEVEFSAVLENHAELSKNGRLAFAVMFGRPTSFVKPLPVLLTTQTAIPAYPMTAVISDERFCGLRHDNSVVLRLMGVDQGVLAGGGPWANAGWGPYDGHVFSGLDEMISAACP